MYNLHKIREIRWHLIHQRLLHLSCLALQHPLGFALKSALPLIIPLIEEKEKYYTISNKPSIYALLTGIR